MWMNGKTGELGGTPRNKNFGDTVMVIRFDDWKGGVTTKVFNLKIKNVNRAPEIIGIPSSTAQEDLMYISRIYAIDRDSIFGDTVHYHWVTRPSWMWMNGRTGELGGTPRYRNLGDTVLSFRLDDWKGGITYYTMKLTIIARPGQLDQKILLQKMGIVKVVIVDF
jgi:hypothetical protein